MNKDAYYFPHFSNARYDRKIRRVRKQLGIEGYGIYFMLLEVLRDQDDFSYPLEDVDLLADEFGTSSEKILVVINTEGLFDVTEKNFFFSPKLIEFLTPYLEGKERNRINGIKGNLIKYGYATKEELNSKSDDEILLLNEIKGDLSGGDKGGDRKESKVKESKVKESKGKESKEEKETKVSKIPSLSEVKEYFEKNGYRSDVAERAFNTYQASIEDHPRREYWRDTRDNLIKNWKQKMQSVWFKEENKIKNENEGVANAPAYQYVN